MFKKILIANRGEIACRIIHTARKLKINSVVIYSDVDKNALHVALADEAYHVGAAPARDSYLNIDNIIAIAKAAKVDAIHPGYGFLSENAVFAARCEAEKIIFIGPSADNIEKMGDKTLAKEIVRALNIPTLPGAEEHEQDLKKLKQYITKIGLPVLIKARAGGGGKGMRLVTAISELEDSIQSAKREAKSSFANDAIFIEKYIDNARHVELQIFADRQGNVVHLFDRDCSVQRRHQKIIEEAPAPNLSIKLRHEMAEAAIKIAKSINYRSAGTIEFLVDANENFYFMEMNTRLQVEHPVTEMITGIDLVEWQMRVAMGEALPLKQEQITMTGHAFEARICAEDPAHDFKPVAGILKYISLPSEDEQLRIDIGVQKNDQISIYYDSMIAKLIVHSKDRVNALALMAKALTETYIIGLKTNVNFLHRLATNPDFNAEKINTHFINEHKVELEQKDICNDDLLALMAVLYLQMTRAAVQEYAQLTDDPYSPWFLLQGWRPFRKDIAIIHFWVNTQLLQIKITLESNTRFIAEINNKKHEIEIINQNNSIVTAKVSHEILQVVTLMQGQQIHLFKDGQHFIADFENPHGNKEMVDESATQLSAPMPGTVVEVLVKPNQTVVKGEKLMVLEAMKMEHILRAPADGIVKTVFYKAGDAINEGVELLEFQ